MEPEDIGAAFSCIINGYSEFDFDGSPIYFKHFGIKESGAVAPVYRRTFERAKAMGVPTEEERLKQIIEDGVWSTEKDERIKSLHAEISSLSTAKNRLFIKSQIDHQNRMIANREAQLRELESTKVMSLGRTAETFASQRSNEFFIYKSSFSNSNLNQQICSEEEFDDWDNEKLERLLKSYYKSFENLNTERVKRVAISSSCINLIAISGDTAQGFYGRAAVDLSYLQIELITLAKNYYNIISNATSEIPEEVMSDPKKLENWHRAQSNAKAHDKDDHGGSDSGTSMQSYVGASQEDVEYAGLDKGKKKVGLASKIREKGGFNVDDFLKIG